MRVLVTGGAGYLGSVLCGRLLEEGHGVTVLDSMRHGTPSLLHLCADPRLDIVRGDCRDGRALRPLLASCDAVVPLAAVVGAAACDRDATAAWTTNLEAVRLLLSLRGRGQALVFPATNSGYGTGGAEPCTEDSPLRPLSLYGRSKVAAEEAVLDSGNSVSLRLATLFGASPRMRRDLLVNHLVYLAATQGYAVVYEPGFRRNFVHVRDVADCVAWCLGSWDRVAGRPYNLGNDRANLTKEGLALKVKEHFPDFDVRIGEGRADPDRRDYVVSSERLRRAGFEARRGLDEGIRELAVAYRMEEGAR